MTRRALLRTGLVTLCAAQAVVGFWALIFPRSFYDDFPAPGHPWVALLPPFNEHLVRDVGASYLAFAFIFGVSAVTLHHNLIRPALVGFEFVAVPHFVFHATHLHGFAVPDGIAQTLSLAVIVALPLALIGLTLGRDPSTASRKGPAG